MMRATDERAIPENDPRMVAWRAYRKTAEYANTKHWAGNEDHVDGSLWAAFVRGFEAALAVEGTPKVRVLEWPDRDPKTRLTCKPTGPYCYTIVRAGEGVYRWACTDVWIHTDAAPMGHSPDGRWSDVCRTLDEAKAAAQADYEKRVLSCFEYTTPPAGIREALERDAARWNALLRCARIEVRGSAGFDPKTGKRRHYDNASHAMIDGAKGWVHFSAYFWSEYPGHEDADKKGRWGTVALTALADEVIRKDEEESDATLRGQS